MFIYGSEGFPLLWSLQSSIEMETTTTTIVLILCNSYQSFYFATVWTFAFYKDLSCSIEMGSRKKYTSISCTFVLIIIVIWAEAPDTKLIVICWCSCSMWKGFGTGTIVLLGVLFKSAITCKENMDAVKPMLSVCELKPENKWQTQTYHFMLSYVIQEEVWGRLQPVGAKLWFAAHLVYSASLHNWACCCFCWACVAQISPCAPWATFVPFGARRKAHYSCMEEHPMKNVKAERIKILICCF